MVHFKKKILKKNIKRSVKNSSEGRVWVAKPLSMLQPVSNYLDVCLQTARNTQVWSDWEQDLNKEWVRRIVNGIEGTLDIA